MGVTRATAEGRSEAESDSRVVVESKDLLGLSMIIPFIQRFRGIYPNTGGVNDYSMTMQKTKQI